MKKKREIQQTVVAPLVRVVAADRRKRWDGCFDLCGLFKTATANKIAEYDEIWNNILQNIDRRRIYTDTDGVAAYFKVGICFLESDKKKSLYFIVRKQTLTLAGYELPETKKKETADFILPWEEAAKTKVNGAVLTQEKLQKALIKTVHYVESQSKNPNKYNRKRNLFHELPKETAILTFFLLEAAKTESSRMAVKTLFTGEEKPQIKCTDYIPVTEAWREMAAGKYEQMVTVEEEALYFKERENSSL